MHPEAVLLYKTAKKFHSDLYVQMGKLRKIGAETTDVKEFADMVYAFKNTVKLLEDSRKELNQVITVLEKVCCSLWSQENQSGNAAPIKTDYVSATPKFKISASIPHHTRDREKYIALMTALGVKRELWDVDYEADEKPAVAINFLGFSDLITSYSKQGLPLPPGIDQDYTFPQFQLVTRGRKEVDAS